MDEVPLAGGNMEPVSRVGDTVRRSAGGWTPAVHGLLRAYEAAGIAEAPRAFGFDEAGREVLSWMPGEVLAAAPPEVLWSERVLRDSAILLRRLHDASLPLADRHRAGEPATWRAPVQHPVEVISHGDYAPYNLLVAEARVTGVIDVDFAAPGPRIWDVAYLAYRMAPYAEDSGYDDARFGDRGVRREMIEAAYGERFGRERVEAAIVARLDALAAFTDARAAQTGRSDLRDHAAMYRRDADRLR